MEVKLYTTIDRADWPSGPWDGEPDKVQWQDETTGLPCLAVRHPVYGSWCGYVGVPPSHPAYEKSYDEVNVQAHGGLNFAEACFSGGDEARSVCHVPAPGEPDHVWWFGFDCAHSSDYGPYDVVQASRRGFLLHGQSYRTLDYVQERCVALAAQLVAL